MLSHTLKKQYINDLVEWIEANLTDELNIDLISLKSGYSKWHMQRMFKEMTGQTLASYTRKRRLTMSAMALRLTRMSLIDIAVRFGFDNQQNFTRVFKNHFAVTPGAFRRIPELQLKSFQSRIVVQPRLVQPQLVEKASLTLCGEMINWECAFGNYIQEGAQKVALHAREFVAFAGQQVTCGWLGFQYGPGCSAAEQQHISLFQALESQYADVLTRDVVNWSSPAGLYAWLPWSGTPEELTAFIADIYYLYLPQMGVARRQGKDLLKLDMKLSTPEWLKGEFYIPVSRE
ncbi:helix-turn-helix domain-containing protein [[Erwinia] mediterraneensis]|uniref:helix-turn-helix domain-containing protein n=1 Tax=[Erwinia] mediterraneensis TaxID=2161819 RepID=UPI001031CD54|nr:helix-turn-helix domain-containing protein [[Erwinia] mediterraneensis]